jgi:uroporphyrin-III C-methyltransferase/precorrin-2 dehydrogenase/sirohydrochlorin ferrochelatase
VIADGSTPAQRVLTTTLADLGRVVSEAGVRPPAVWVVGDVVALRNGAPAAVPDDAAAEPDDE